MGVGLMPLEFTDCLTDSPWFRENLHKHEKELDKTSQQIKRLIKEVKDLLQAAKRKFFHCFLFTHQQNKQKHGSLKTFLNLTVFVGAYLFTLCCHVRLGCHYLFYLFFRFYDLLLASYCNFFVIRLFIKQ